MNSELSMIENEIEKIQNQYNIAPQQRLTSSSLQNNRNLNQYIQDHNANNQPRHSTIQSRRTDSFSEQNNQMGTPYQRVQNSSPYDHYINNPQVNELLNNNQMLNQMNHEFTDNIIYPLNDQEQIVLQELLQRSNYNNHLQSSSGHKQKQNNQQQNLTSSSIFLMPKPSNQSNIPQDIVHQQEIMDVSQQNPNNHVKLQPLNFSMNQTMLTNGNFLTSQSPQKSPSQAAISALKALQDRIKELEKENLELKQSKQPTGKESFDEMKRQIKILSTQIGMVEDEKRRHLELNAIEKYFTQYFYVLEIRVKKRN